MCDEFIKAYDILKKILPMMKKNMLKKLTYILLEISLIDQNIINGKNTIK